MCQQRGITDELGHFVHHLVHRRRTAQHGGGDASEPGDEGRYRHTRVHQALVALDDAPALQHHHRHLSGAAAGAGADAGGFKVDDSDTFHEKSQCFSNSAPSMGT
ncbi:hypothetical protein D3C75_767410 [compost metagenome]